MHVCAVLTANTIRFHWITVASWNEKKKKKSQTCPYHSLPSPSNTHISNPLLLSQTRTHTQTHTHTYTRARAHTRAHTHTHTHARTHAHTHARTHARTHAQPHTRMHARATHTHARTHTHTHTHTCTHASMHKNTRTHASMHTHTHTANVIAFFVLFCSFRFLLADLLLTCMSLGYLNACIFFGFLFVFVF